MIFFPPDIRHILEGVIISGCYLAVTDYEKISYDLCSTTKIMGHKQGKEEKRVENNRRIKAQVERIDMLSNMV